MKTRSSSVLILAATLSAIALIPSTATAGNSPAIGYNVSEVTPAANGYDAITRGASRTYVRLAFGHPLQELSPDIWLYSGFHADLASAEEQGCDTLVVTFAQDRVADLKLVNRGGARAIMALLRVQPKSFVAANQ